MSSHQPIRPRLLLDADVLFAGAASPSEHGASLLILKLAEITLIEAIVSQQVITEAERNLAAKLPPALPAFRMIVARSLQVVPDPSPTDLAPYRGLAEAKDLPVLVAALRQDCPWLVTFNVRHYQPCHPDLKVLRPGDFVQRVREQLAYLTVPHRP